MSRRIRHLALPVAGVGALVVGAAAAQTGAVAAVGSPSPAVAAVGQTQAMPAAVRHALASQFEALARREHVKLPHAKASQARKAVVPATAARKADGFDFVNSSYIFTIRSGGIEYYDDIPRELQQEQGFSLVDLLHDIGQPQGRCESFGAAYWLGQEVEEGVLGAGAAPPDAGDVSGGYKNPFTARDVEPNLSPGKNESNRTPGIKNYFPPGTDVIPLPNDSGGYKWDAKCDDESHGRAQGDTFNVGGFQVIGSTSQGALDRTTGMYVGSSRSYFLGQEGDKGFDSGSSFMQITNASGEDAKISYRMSYFNNGDATDKNGITFGGQDIPIQQFADAFNAQAKQYAPMLAAVGPAGIATLEPEVGTSTDGGRYSITISAGHGNLGFAARSGTIGQNQGMRIGSITFQGVYGDKN